MSVRLTRKSTALLRSSVNSVVMRGDFNSAPVVSFTVLGRNSGFEPLCDSTNLPLSRPRPFQGRGGSPCWTEAP